MDEFLEKAGIRLLRDEGTLIDDSFYVYGRPDRERPGRGISVRKTPEEIDGGYGPIQTDPCDRPSAEGTSEELADAGVDLDLCGHTHDGQMSRGTSRSG